MPQQAFDRVLEEAAPRLSAKAIVGVLSGGWTSGGERAWRAFEGDPRVSEADEVDKMIDPLHSSRGATPNVKALWEVRDCREEGEARRVRLFLEAVYATGRDDRDCWKRRRTVLRFLLFPIRAVTPEHVMNIAWQLTKASESTLVDALALSYLSYAAGTSEDGRFGKHTFSFGSASKYLGFSMFRYAKAKRRAILYPKGLYTNPEMEKYWRLKINYGQDLRMHLLACMHYHLFGLVSPEEVFRSFDSTSIVWEQTAKRNRVELPLFKDL